MKKTIETVLKKMNKAGYPSYVIGGYPRDLYLKKQSLDIDVCTSAKPKEIKAVFPSAQMSKEQYGSVTLMENNLRFEITTFRKEKNYHDYRRPGKIKYVTNLKEDLKRRDFTMNTLCIDCFGNLIDLLEGIRDIDQHLIRMVGNPKQRLKEDILRILRAIRFATILNFELDPELKIYIVKYRKLLKHISYQRKKEELDKIFASPNKQVGFDLIIELQLTEPLELIGLEHIKKTTAAIGIWAQLKVLDKYPFNANEKGMILSIEKSMDQDLLNPVYLYHTGSYIASLTGEIKGISRKKIIECYQNLPIKSRKEIMISSSDICLLYQTNPGPFLKEIWTNLEQAILTKKIVNEKQAIISYLEKQK